MLKAHPLLRVLFSTLIVLMLLQQLHWAGRRLLAEISATPALAKLEWWSEWDIDPADAQWQPVKQSFQAALRHMPNDPELLAQMGDLYTQRLSDDALTEEQISQAVVLGSQSYRYSLMQRPTWVRDWDDLALIKYNQKLYADAEFQLALRQMVRFGRQRQGLMELVIDMSIKAWPELDDNTRDMLVTNTNIEQVRAQRSATKDLDVTTDSNVDF